MHVLIEEDFCVIDNKQRTFSLSLHDEVKQVRHRHAITRLAILVDPWPAILFGQFFANLHFEMNAHRFDFERINVQRLPIAKIVQQKFVPRLKRIGSADLFEVRDAGMIATIQSAHNRGIGHRFNDHFGTLASAK